MKRVNGSTLMAMGALALGCGTDPEIAPAGGGSPGSSGSGGSPVAAAGGGAGGNSAAGSSSLAGSDGQAASGSSIDAGGSGEVLPEPPPPYDIPPYHLGAPFAIVDGVISAESNEYGLQASFYAIKSPTGATLEVTRDTGQICLRGEVARVAEGPFGGNFAGFGFISGENVFVDFPEFGLAVNLDTAPSLAATYGASSRIVINPDGPIPWSLGGSVIGISARVSGPIIPVGPGGVATPGGLDPDASAANQYGNCHLEQHPAGSDARTVELIFPAMHFYCWNTPELPYTQWTGDSAIVFGWGVGSVRVPGIAPEDPITIPPDPYDFCLSDIRPIVVGDGPDDPGPEGDAGTGTGADAGSTADAAAP